MGLLRHSRDRFGFSRAHPYRLVDAAVVVDNLSKVNKQDILSPNRRQVMPTKTEQVRSLVALKPSEQQ